MEQIALIIIIKYAIFRRLHALLCFNGNRQFVTSLVCDNKKQTKENAHLNWKRCIFMLVFTIQLMQVSITSKTIPPRDKARDTTWREQKPSP